MVQVNSKFFWLLAPKGSPKTEMDAHRVGIFAVPYSNQPLCHFLPSTPVASPHSPGRVELHEPQTVALDDLSVEVAWRQLDDGITGGVEAVHSQEEGAAHQAYGTHGCQGGRRREGRTVLAMLLG